MVPQSGESDYMRCSSGNYFRFRVMTGFERDGLFTFQFETNGGVTISYHRVVAKCLDYLGGSVHNGEHFDKGGIFRPLVEEGHMKEGQTFFEVFACDPKSPSTISLLATGKCTKPGRDTDTDHGNGRDKQECNGFLRLILTPHQENIIRHFVRLLFGDWLQPQWSASYEGGNKKPDDHTWRRDIPFLSLEHIEDITGPVEEEGCDRLSHVHSVDEIRARAAACMGKDGHHLRVECCTSTKFTLCMQCFFGGSCRE